MQKNSILVVSTDVEFYTLIRDVMGKRCMEAHHAIFPTEIIGQLTQYSYCLVIIDVPSLEKEYIDLIRTIRESMAIPILILTENAEEEDKVVLFYNGANAVLEKSSNVAIYTAQAESLIKLYLEAPVDDIGGRTVTFGNELIIDSIYRQVIVDGEQLSLTRTEFDLLFCLAQHPGQVWSRSQLYHQIWNDNLGLTGDNIVHTHIGNLRKKLAALGKNYIQNSRGVGYKFVSPW